MKRTLKREELIASAGNAPADGQVLKQFVTDSIEKMDGQGDRVRRFCISTSAVDRDNDTISAAGWNLDNYRKNGVVLWAHDYRSLPIGKALQVGVEGGKLVATAEFADHEFANTVLRLIDGGFLRATSVGFRPTKYAINEERRGLDFVEQELLEFSIVPVPANPEALIEARSAGIDLTVMKDWADTVLKAIAEPEPEPKSAKSTLVVDIDVTAARADVDALRAEVEDLSAKAADAVASLKAGRVLSAANEGRLRQAKDHLDAVLAQVAAAEDAPADATEETAADDAEAADKSAEAASVDAGDPDVLLLAKDDDLVLELDDDAAVTAAATTDDDVEFDPAELRDVLRELVVAEIGAIVRETTETTMNRLRGRVD